MRLSNTEVCFVCGADNADGLRLSFEIDADARTLKTQWTPDERFQGFSGIIHGGLVATVLDEAVAKLCVEVGIPAVTAGMDIRFLKPVSVGELLTIHGRIETTNGRVVTGVSEVIKPDGTVAARAVVKMIRGKS